MSAWVAFLTDGEDGTSPVSRASSVMKSSMHMQRRSSSDQPRCNAVEK